MTDLNLDDLRAELAEFAKPEKSIARTAREERTIAGFEEIQRFVDQHGRAPEHGEELDIFERLYAVRLDRLRSLDDCRTLLVPLDRQRLLEGTATLATENAEEFSLDALAAELRGAAGDESITELRHVRTSADKRAAEEIANREKCDDFDQFRPLFNLVRQELNESSRETRPIDNSENSLAEIRPGAFFIVGGQIAYVAGESDAFTTDYQRSDRRLRIIYDNGTESGILARSFQKSLYRDSGCRRVSDPSAGPLFSREGEDDDQASGTIYVLRSKSDHPTVSANREVLHKIGVTGGDVSRRIAGAKLDPTFLMADVEIVASYDLYNINRSRLENIIHRVFGPARLDIEVKDRFGNPIVPREWFLAPIFVIDEAVERIRDGTITSYVYDPTKAALTRDG